jgi:hypothetical protein
MRSKWLRWALMAGAAVVVSVAGGVLSGQAPAPGSGSVDRSGTALLLAPPAFAQATGGSFLEREAGISVYVNTGQTIDLARARPLFRVIEDETAEYIIGTVELSGYGEDWWPHVWIDTGGWIVVYYRRDEPTSKLMHWPGFALDQTTVTTTTLREVLVSVARQLRADMTRVEADMRYYHWQHSDATRMLIVVDTTNAGSDSFRYTIPPGMSLSEVTGSHRGVGIHVFGRPGRQSWTQINGENFLVGGEGTYILLGRVPDNHTMPQAANTVSLHHQGGWAGVALFFLYR